jgi:signal transduction histidine kinase
VLERTSELEAAVQQHQLAKLAVTNLLHRLVSSQEDERARIARDLHDHLGQQLTALRLTLERGRQQEGSDGVGGADIVKALELTDRLNRDVDFLAWELRPAALDQFGLAAALPRYLTEWSSHVGIPSEFRLAGFEPGQLPPDAEVAFYRVAQEALNNVSKHAHATRVDVVLAAAGGQVVLVIEDDGTGFEPSEHSAISGGLGLAGMRERAALVGAALDIESAPDEGTSVFLRRSIPDDQPAGDTARLEGERRE